MLPLASPLHLMSGCAITSRASTTTLLLLELHVYYLREHTALDMIQGDNYHVALGVTGALDVWSRNEPLDDFALVRAARLLAVISVMLSR
jgi:hypothetical protein